MFVYEYDIQNANGTWNDKTVMQTAIPQGPVYEQLSVDAYNKFATEYNKYMADRTEKPTCYLLEQINPAANWMDGNEGDPDVYKRQGHTYPRCPQRYGAGQRLERQLRQSGVAG